MARFRVLVGQHVEGKNPDGTQRIYHQGDVVDSRSDLLKHNIPGNATKKFERLDDTPHKSQEYIPPPQPSTSVESAKSQPQPQESNPPQVEPQRSVGVDPLTKEVFTMLDNLTLAELKNYAKEESVDLKGATTKPEILKVLKDSVIGV